MIAANLVIYFGVALLIYLRARQSLRNVSVVGFVRYVIPFAQLKSATSIVDLCFYVIGKITAVPQRALQIFVTVLIADFAHGLFTAAGGPSSPAPLPVIDLAACYLIVFLVGDLIIYVTHRLMHVIPALWELHKVHHSATFLSPFTKYRQHPIDDLFNNIPNLIGVGFVVATIQYFYVFSDTQAAVMLATLELVAVVVTLDPFRHSHLPVSFGPVDLVLQSPNMHRLHHSSNPDHFGRNFGQRLSVWDWIFGTAMVPAADEPMAFGLGGGEDEDYNTIVRSYVTPVVRSVDRIRGRGSEARSGFPSSTSPPEAGPLQSSSAV